MIDVLNKLAAQGIKVTGAKELIYVLNPSQEDKALLMNEGWDYYDDGMEDIFGDEVWERVYDTSST